MPLLNGGAALLAGRVQDLRAFVAERDWAQFHNPKNLVMLLMGELLAEYRWVSTEEADAYGQTEPQRARIAAEAADVGIALLLFCGRVGIDLMEQMRVKIQVNRANYPVEQARGWSERPPRI